QEPRLASPERTRRCVAPAVAPLPEFSRAALPDDRVVIERLLDLSLSGPESRFARGFYESGHAAPPSTADARWASHIAYLCLCDLFEVAHGHDLQGHLR